jgi:hypothetical protein
MVEHTSKLFNSLQFLERFEIHGNGMTQSRDLEKWDEMTNIT